MSVVVVVYGMTEATGAICGAIDNQNDDDIDAEDGLRSRSGSVGVPLLHTRMKVTSAAFTSKPSDISPQAQRDGGGGHSHLN